MRDLKSAGNMLCAVLLTLTAATGITACLDSSSSDPAPDSGALTITTGSPLPPGNKATPYSTTLAAAGGKPGYTWSVKTGPGMENLPAGLQLSAAGVISGIPTTVETRSPVFKVVDTSPLPQAVEKTLTISINTVPVPTISAPGSLPDGIVSTPYSATLTAAGGTPPYTTWSVTPPLPTGLFLTPAGETATVTGSLAAPYNNTHTFSVTDSFSPTPQIGTRNYTLTFTNAPLPLLITTASLAPDGTAFQPYNRPLAANGGTAPLTWSISSSSPNPLPAGLSLTAGGLLSGTTTSAANTPVRFRVQDVGTPVQSDERTLTITINLPAPPNITTTSPLPNGVFDQFYSRTLTVQNGIPPFVWSFTGGSQFPNWLDLNTQTGVISGTPDATGTFNIKVQVTDGAGQIDPTPPSLLITIDPQAPPTITPFTLPNGTVNQPYPTSQNPNIQLAATGGIPPYTWSVTPALPNGLQFNILGPGIISGTPLNASVTPTTHTFKVTDSTVPTGQFSELARNLTINSALTIGTTSPLSPSGTVGDSYGPLQLSASGGTPPYTWSISGTGAPNEAAPGLTLSSDGVISGRPSNAVDSPFTRTYRVQDDNGAEVTKSLALPVNSALTIDTDNTTLPLSAGIETQPYSGTLAASGGTQPYTWSVDPLTPLSLSLNSSTGEITGAPNSGTAGTTSHNFTVQDSASHSASKSLNLTISP